MCAIKTYEVIVQNSQDNTVKRLIKQLFIMV